MHFLKKFLLGIGATICSIFSTAQEGNLNENFKKAFDCKLCPDAVQIALYTTAIDAGISDPVDLANFHNALVNRAQLFARNKKFEKAIADYDLALAIMPESHYVYQQLGTLYLEMGKYDKAITHFNAFIRNTEAQMREALEFYKETSNENTIMREELKQEWNQQVAPAYNNRALAHAYSGDHLAACQDFKRAYEAGMRELKQFLDESCQ